MKSKQRRTGHRLLSIFLTALAGLLIAAPALAGDGKIDSDGTMDFEFNFRFPPTSDQITLVKDQLQRASGILCDATDGQVRVENVRLTAGGPREDKAAYWFYAEPGRSAVTFWGDGSGLRRSGAHVTLFQSGVGADVIAHEMGHLGFGLGDEYDEQSRWGGPCGIGPSFDAGSFDERNHSIMQQIGGMRCVGAGGSTGIGCMRDTDCATGQTCRPVLMSELSTDGNHDPLVGNNMGCSATCTDTNCGANWNSTTSRFEQTQQSAMHGGDSDWATIVANYPFLSAPTALPTEAAPTVCSTAINFTDDVTGTDQVMLILDKSGSMSELVNSADAASGTKLAFLKAAAKAYIDLQAGRGVDLAMINFDSTPTIARFFAPLGAGDAAGVKTLIDALTAGGNTGIGTALTTSLSEFQRVATAGRNRTAFLLSDGQNTDGENPLTAAERLRNQGVKVFSIPVGTAADRTTLTSVAGTTGGSALNAANGSELPAIFAELFALYRGESLLLPRTRSAVKGNPPIIRSLPQTERLTISDVINTRFPVDLLDPIIVLPPELPLEQSFPLDVEVGAQRLNVILSALNTNLATWAPHFIVKNPSGTAVIDTALGIGTSLVRSDALYRLAQIPSPTPGRWTLTIHAPNSFDNQISFVQAHIENPNPDCFVGIDAKLVRAGDKLVVSANASYGAELDGVEFKGLVVDPKGRSFPLTFTRDPSTRAISAPFGDTSEKGLYEIFVSCNAGAGAKLMAGEKIFSGPETPSLPVQAFSRTARGTFAVDLDPFPPCSKADCDGDGITNDVEGDKDLDFDRFPNKWDLDSDGDNIPDDVETPKDGDNDGRPNSQDPDSDNDGVKDIDEGVNDGDKDGIPSSLDPDSDNDGIPDVCDATREVPSADVLGPDNRCRTSSDPLDPAALGCQQIATGGDIGAINLNFTQLKKASQQALKELQKASKTTRDKALGKRLAKSAKDVKKNLDLLYKQAGVNLSTIPATVLKCPDAPRCVTVDNTMPLNQYKDALLKIGNLALRTLNRATRLTSSSLKEAKAKSKALDKKIKRINKQTVERLNALPLQQSKCF